MNWPKLIAWTVILSLSLLFWAVVFGAALAKAAPPEPKAPAPRVVPVSAADIQPIADRTARWLARTLLAEVRVRPIVVTDALTRAENAGEFYVADEHGPERILVRPWIAEAIVSRQGVNVGSRQGYFPGGAHLLLHELLHRADTAACWHPGPGEVDVEEGIVDALAVDLAPAWGRAFWGERIFVLPHYRAEVAAVRAASARATGSASWRTREARSWRRSLWGASCEGRSALLREAVR